MWHKVFEVVFLCKISYIFAIVPINEVNILSDLYYATNGENWLWRPTLLAGVKWNFNTTNINPCSTNRTTWQGIKCDNSPRQCDSLNKICHITVVNLETYRLAGTLPDRWNELPALEHIDLGSNNLHGTFPRTLIPPIQLHTFYIEINSLSGPLPGEVIEKMTSLVNLDLSNNGFTGPFPTQLGSLTLLEHLEFRRLAVTGGIPTSVGNLLALTLLDFTGCLLTGWIPSELGKLTALLYLDMDINLFSGTIPSTLGSLHAVTLFDLSYNRLTGTIPPSLGSLTSVSKLNLQYNMLTGTIPSTFGSLSQAIDLILPVNFLTGNIPTTLSTLTRMTNLDLINNYLTGEIPGNLWNLTRLELLNLGTNHITGTLPPSISGLSKVSWLNLLVNQISGTIPREIHNLKLLKYFYLGYNLVSGPLVCDSSNFLTINLLDIQENYLTGSLCRTFAKSISDLRLSSNMLSGTIPTGIGFLQELKNLKLDRNHLHGQIPPQFKNMSSLISLSIAHNRLTHCIPSDLGQLLNLRQLYLQSNSLECGLDSALFIATTINWVNLDLSDNLFSGVIPPDLFRIPTLETIILTSNCFHGTLPSEICRASNLIVLSADGLGASSDCPGADLLSLRRDRLLDGTIPSCLWSLENITTISLSGNGFTGTIGQFPLRSRLQNVTLSHNKLSGTIPRNVQEHSFVLLDLSFNRLTGEVNDMRVSPIAKRSNIILEVNRLSGALNHIDVVNPNLQLKLNVLSGNLFSCRYLPTKDQSYEEYLCGSQDLDRSMIVLGTVNFLIILVSGLLLWSLNSKLWFWKVLRSYWSDIFKYLQVVFPNPSIREFNFHIKLSSRLTVLLSLCTIFMLLPFYILRTTDKSSVNSGEEEHYHYSTHTHLYRWSWSIVHSTGQLPSALIVSAWFVCSLLFVSGSKILHLRRIDSLSLQQNQPTLIVLSLLIADLTIISGVNAAYIYSTMQNISSTSQFMIKIFLAVFNFIWSEGFSRSSHVVLNVSYAILKNIIIPCLATAFTSKSCFQNLLIPPTKITSYYEYEYCRSYSVLNTDKGSYVFCAENIPFYSSVEPFTPPFTYNFICFSTILKAYLPVFIYTYCLKIVIPICVSYIAASYVRYESLPNFLRSRARGILWPMYWKDYSRTSTIFSGLHDDQRDDEKNGMENSLNPRSLFQPARALGSMAQDFSLLLTFGLCSPILALAIAMHSILSSYHVRILIARFIFLQQTESHPNISIRTLEKCLVGVAHRTIAMVWPIVWSSCFFIVFLCWEISGDAIGWEQSVWVPITVIGLTVILHVVASGPIFTATLERLVRYLEIHFNIKFHCPGPLKYEQEQFNAIELLASPATVQSDF